MAPNLHSGFPSQPLPQLTPLLTHSIAPELVCLWADLSKCEGNVIKRQLALETKTD